MKKIFAIALALMLMAKFAMWNEDWNGALVPLQALEELYGDFNEGNYPLAETQWRYKNPAESIFEIQHAWSLTGTQYNGNVAAIMMPTHNGDGVFDGVPLKGYGTSMPGWSSLRANNRYAIFRPATGNTQTENAAYVDALFNPLPLTYDTYDATLNRYTVKIDREALAAQYIDWYGAIPAGPRVTQCELLADTELSPRRSLMISGVGAADYELRKRNLALLTVHGPMRPQGAQAWGQIRTSGLSSVRPVEILRALWGEGECDVQSMVMPCDGAVPGVTHGRFVEGPAHVAKDGPVGQPVELPIELEDVMEQLSLVNRLYAEAAATGSRNTLREALEIDPALTGVDLLYAEGVVADMLENQKEKYPRFFRE